MRYFLLVSLLVTACGGDDDDVGALPDAPPPSDAGADAGMDAGMIDAPPPEPRAPVTLTVTRNGQPVPNVHTYFLNADSSLVAIADTDAAGSASKIMADGGSVTALDPFPPRDPEGTPPNELRTFAGVKAGDHLVLNLDDAELPPVNVAISVPEVDGADGYEVFTTCGTGSLSASQAGDDLVAFPSGELALSGCNGAADILVIATSEGVRTRALYRANVPVTIGINLTADLYHALADVKFEYRNLSGDAFFVGVTHRLATPLGALDIGLGDSGSIVEGAASFTIAEPVVPGAIGIVETEVGMFGRHRVFDRESATDTYALDAAGLLLPGFFELPSYNKTTRRISWVETRDGATPDLTLAEIAVFRSQDRPEQPPEERRWRWTIVAPYVAGEIVFPSLPTDVATWAPALGDDVTPSVTSAKVPGKYDAVREHILDRLDPAALVVSASDRVVTVAAENQGALAAAAPARRTQTSGLLRGSFTRRTR